MVLRLSLLLVLVCFSSAATLPNELQTQESNMRTIPLESIYITSSQEGLKRLSPSMRLDKDGSKKYSEPYGAALSEIEHIALRMGASNIFLVHGAGISEAIGTTSTVFIESWSVDSPPWRPFEKSDHCWLVVFFGVRASGPEFLVKTVEISGTNIRVTFTTPQHERLMLTDRRPYLAWAPVGKLAPGTYTLELYDGTAETLRLLRRVTVPPRN